MGAVGHNSPGGKRLDSWKEIGAFFNRDERTVKRWEATRGLPVHRVPGGGRVYAYAEELKAWLESAGTPVEAVPAKDEPEAAVTPEPAPLPPAPPKQRISPTFVVLVAILVIGGALLVARPPWRAREPAHAAVHKADPKAEELYMTGIYYWHKRTPESLNKAVDAFTQSIVVDPNYAPAYVGLADCYNLLREYSSMPASEAYPRAIAAARRAIALDDSLSGAHSSLAFAEFYWSWQMADAEKEFRRAIELSPNSVPAHHWYATSLLELGRYPEAMAEINRAQTLDPQSTAIRADKGFILYFAGQKEEGVALLRSIEAAEPDFFSSHGYLATIALQENQDREYLTEGRRAAELRHDTDQLAVLEAAERGFASGGRHGMLEAMLAAQKKLHAADKVTAYALAETCAWLGDIRGALDYLQESYAKRESTLVGMRVSPTFATLHGDPMFRELVKKVGLPPLD